MVYVTIGLIPIASATALWALIGLGTLPIAAKACAIALKDYDDPEKLIPALGMNVITVLATDALLAIAFLIVMM